MAGESTLVKQSFQEQYAGAGQPRLFRAPGRVNLIGEHTDYNLGLVLPIALEMACFCAAAPNADDKLRVYSANVQQSREWSLSDIPHATRAGHWSDYPLGIAQQLHRAGYELRGVSLALHSTVPSGSGLSSSAAIEVSSALAILQGRRIAGRDLALLAQRAEVEFVGVPCGIMDQYVSVFGERDRAVFLDCRTISHHTVPLPEGAVVLAVNSMVKHSLGSSAYETRVRECAAAVEAIQQVRPEVRSLRDASIQDLEDAKQFMPGVIFRRARHVITEDERVHRFIEASNRSDLKEMGTLFLQSHLSLREDYEVSCEELDFLVDAASKMPGVYGARMTGGGFGGCTVNLIVPGNAEVFRKAITEAYEARFNRTPQIYTCNPSAGAGELA